MSQISEELNRLFRERDSLETNAGMYYAFDLPFNGDALMKLVNHAIGSNTPLHISLSVEGEQIILGFENADSGNKLLVSFDKERVILPDWLVEGDNHFVTSEKTLSSIDIDRGRYSSHGMGEQMIAIIGLNGLWLTAVNAPNWGWRTLSNEEPLLTSLLSGLPQSTNMAYMGGKAIYNSHDRYNIEITAKVTYKTIAMAKTILGKAGRSKPQGDLIVYFNKDSCAIEGYNSSGVTTLELRGPGTNRQIKSFVSSLPEETQVAVKFGYPQIFKGLFSKRTGALYEINAEGDMSYGISDGEKPVLEFDLTDVESADTNLQDFTGCKITIVYQDSLSVFSEEKDIPPLVLTKTVRRKLKTKEIVEEVVYSIEIDLSKYPEEHQEEIQKWIDCHLKERALKGLNLSDNITKWFTSYLMKCANEGTEISETTRDIYNEVKSL
jgi:hypothetical protein